MTMNPVTAPSEAVASRPVCSECERLRGCLDRANNSAEDFERKWYLAQDELEDLQEEQRATSSRPYRPDAKRVDAGDFTLASGQCVCDRCGCLYFEHAPVQGFEFMHRLCDGRLIKL